MKKILVLLALLFGFTATYAQFNGPITTSYTLKTKVIKPLSIVNDQAQKPTTIPQVIKGQVRDLNPDESFLSFKISKEPNTKVAFQINFAPYPVNGVKLDGSWVFQPGDNDLENIGKKVVIPKSGSWTWDPTDPADMTVYLKIDKIDATAATAFGTARFTATMSGSYTGL